MDKSTWVALIEVGTKCFVSGWGKTKPMKFGEIPHKNNEAEELQAKLLYISRSSHFNVMQLFSSDATLFFFWLMKI